MKTTEDIQQHIESLKADAALFHESDPGRKKAVKRIQEMQTVLHFLESAPDQQALEKQRDKISERLERIRNTDAFDAWLRNNPGKKKGAYLSELGYDELFAQHKTLTFILS